MFRWPVSLLALAACAQAQPQPPTVFRTDVNMVHIIASVKDAKGDLFGALQQSDFQVFDNGVRQDIRVFERQTSLPLSIALLIDASGSTAKDLKYETDSAAKFLKALLANSNPQDQVAIFSFDSDVNEIRPGFTHNHLILENELRGVKGSGGTSLYDAILLASKELEHRSGRKVMIVIGDGGDTTSVTHVDQALKAAQFADAVIYPIVDLPITNDAGRNTGGEHALIFMAEGTGGHAFFPNAAGELDKAFSDIIDELRAQYFLGYYPRGAPPSKNGFHELQVRVDRPDLRVFARQGYYGEAESTDRSPDPQVAVSPAERKKK